MTASELVENACVPDRFQQVLHLSASGQNSRATVKGHERRQEEGGRTLVGGERGGLHTRPKARGARAFARRDSVGESLRARVKCSEGFTMWSALVGIFRDVRPPGKLRCLRGA